MITATITGRDDISLQVLQALAKGEKVKNLPFRFPITIDQAKILSRYRRMLQKSKGNISPSSYAMMEKIGIKALKLAPLLKQQDWEGLNDVLSVVTKDTKRDEIGMFLDILQDKRKRLYRLQQEVNEKRETLERQITDGIEKDKELSLLQAEVEELLSSIQSYPQPIQVFIKRHVGFYHHRLILAKRVDVQLRNALRDKNILVTDEESGVCYLQGLHPFAFELEQIGVYRNANAPSAYTLPTGKAQNVNEIQEWVLLQRKQLKHTQRQAEKDLKQLRKPKPRTLREEIGQLHQSSSLIKEREQHDTLQQVALHWLVENEYVGMTKYALPNAQVVDCIGQNRKGRVVIVEARTTWEEWLTDKSWTTAVDYADEFYFLVPSDVYQRYTQQEIKLWNEIAVRKESIGILEWDKKNLIQRKDSQGHMKSIHPTDLLFEIAKTANNQ